VELVDGAARRQQQGVGVVRDLGRGLVLGGVQECAPLWPPAAVLLLGEGRARPEVVPEGLARGGLGVEDAVGVEPLRAVGRRLRAILELRRIVPPGTRLVVIPGGEPIQRLLEVSGAKAALRFVDAADLGL
jgi:hypothetical protein